MPSIGSLGKEQKVLPKVVAVSLEKMLDIGVIVVPRAGHPLDLIRLCRYHSSCSGSSFQSNSAYKHLRAPRRAARLISPSAPDTGHKSGPLCPVSRLKDGYALEGDTEASFALLFCSTLLEAGLFHPICCLTPPYLIPFHLPSRLSLDTPGREVGHHLWRRGIEAHHVQHSRVGRISN